MRRAKPVEAKHFIASFRQLINRGASHRAETDYDRVEVIDHELQWDQLWESHHRLPSIRLIYSKYESFKIAIASREERLRKPICGQFAAQAFFACPIHHETRHCSELTA